MNCQFAHCFSEGRFSCSEAYAQKYEGEDGDLLFCLPHFLFLFQFYADYKDLEKEAKKLLPKHPVKQREDSVYKPSLHRRFLLAKALELRELFNSYLAIPTGLNHLLYMVSMRRSLIPITEDDLAQTLGIGWTMVSSKKRHCRGRHICR